MKRWQETIFDAVWEWIGLNVAKMPCKDVQDAIIALMEPSDRADFLETRGKRWQADLGISLESVGYSNVLRRVEHKQIRHYVLDPNHPDTRKNQEVRSAEKQARIAKMVAEGWTGHSELDGLEDATT